MTVSLADFDGVLLDGLDFCARTYELYEQVRTSPNGANRLRRRPTALERKLVQELLPIAKYVQHYYQAGRYISVKWVHGNQNYDAELRQHGVLVEMGYYPPVAYLEVTSAMHPNEHRMRELVAQGKISYAPEGIKKVKGKIVSRPHVFRNNEALESFAPLVVRQIREKVRKSYPTPTSLVIECTLNRLYTPDEWRMLVDMVIREMPEHQFFEVLMYDPVSQHTSPVYRYS